VIQKEIKNGRDRYLLYLEGNGLKELMAKPGVQGLRCKSNHIMEMAEVLGIEAGR
jgi:DNA-directed RNA polymerase III subunit RPC1